MTYIPVNFDDAVESKPAQPGKYNLQITKCELTKTGPNSAHPGTPMFKVTIGFTDNANTPNITHFATLPNEDDLPEKALGKALFLKRFLALFSVPYDRGGIDTEQLPMDMVGCSAYAEVSLSEPDDSGNVYNRLQIPRIKGE
jgi:hypothetical protein